MNERLLGPTEAQLIRELSRPDPRISSLYYLRTYFLIGLTVALNQYWDNTIFLLVSVVFIGARQHSLYVLNHDASHGNLFQSPGLNYWVSFFLSVAPFFHHPEAFSYTQWRRVHLLHHGNLMTEQDPNFLGRRAKGEAHAPISLGHLIKEMLLAGPQSLYAFFFGKQDKVAQDLRTFEKDAAPHLGLLIFPIKGDREMELERKIKIFVMGLALLVVHLSHNWRVFALFWLLPMYTVYPTLLKFMDLTEHHWFDRSQELSRNTASAMPGWAGKIFVSDLNRSLHREHHLFMKVPFYRLPQVARVLAKAQVLPIPQKGLLVDHS